MRVAGIERVGDEVQMLDVPDPRALRDGEVLIEIRAAGVGNWDEFVRLGEWDVGRGPPMALGVEAAGVVVDVGIGAERWSDGAGVLMHALPFADQGTWAPWLIARADLLVPKPKDVSWTCAAAFPVPALTATQVLDGALQVKAGETLLVSGAGGATGRLLLSLAVVRGVRVLATAGPASRERVLAAGAAVVFDYHDADWPETIKEATGGRGVDAAANAAKAGAATAMRAVADGGRLATITSDPPEPERGIAVESLYVRPDATQLERATEALGAGQLAFTLGATFPLAEASTALHHAVAGGGAVALAL